MTNSSPPEEPEFETFDTLPDRVKQPAWRWWRQPLGLFIVGILLLAVGTVTFANRPKTIFQTPFVLPAALNDTSPASTFMTRFRGRDLALGDLVVPEQMPALNAGDRACLHVQKRPLDEALRYVLYPIDQC